jgi:benzoate-CoA ligase
MDRPAERFNFAQHLLAVGDGRAGKVAYIDDAGRLTYGELAERVRRFAQALRELGIRREERVLLMMHDTTDWPVVFLGSLYAGVVPVAVNTLLPPADVAYILEHSRAQAAFVSAPLAAVVQAAMSQGTHEVRTLVVSRGPASPDDLEPMIAQSAPLAVAAATTPDEPGFWLYSSGSTGRPKAAVHTHGNLLATADLYGKPVLGLREDDLCFSAAKLFFAYGLGNALTFPLSVGASVLLMAERPTPDAIFRRWVDHRPTVYFGAPTGYAGMLASPNLPAREQVALRLCSSAGEALPREIGERFTRHFGCEIIDGIGSTEMLHIFISNRPGDVRYGTSGKPVEGYRAELRDEQGRLIAASHEIGDLYIEGPSAALMYWGDRRRSREAFQGAWTRTGDKYRRDDDGYYVYAGRSDDMFKVSGQYVSPFEVEATLMEHPSVLEAAVIGIADRDGLTRPKACVVLRDATQPSDHLSDELKQFVKDRLAPHKYPRVVEFLAELPKTATGKLQRVRLREREAALKTTRT